jgi:Fe-Mn family superoxide dismutase
MSVTLPDLPYDYDALEPHISARTMKIHHDRHHQKYVDTLNELIEGTRYDAMELERIIKESAKKEDETSIFNNAGQVWNHSLFWSSMTPKGGGAPDDELADAIARAFGSVDDFRESFKETATGTFGSSWTWLVLRNGRLSVEGTQNADSPLTSGGTPLLACDMWEHAYYLDYQNEKGKFVDAYLENLVDWSFALNRLRAMPRAAA